MSTKLLCPVYQKWLRLHPEHARVQRHLLRSQARSYQHKGELNKAMTFNQLGWEIAQVVLMSPRSVDQYSAQSRKDLVVFVASAMAVYRCAQEMSKTSEQYLPNTAKSVIQDTQHQLVALLPLYASEPALVNIIQELLQWLEPDNQVVSSRQLH